MMDYMRNDIEPCPKAKRPYPIMRDYVLAFDSKTRKVKDIAAELGVTSVRAGVLIEKYRRVMRGLGYERPRT